MHILGTSAKYYVTAFVIMVSLMYYQYWFWYPAAVTVTSWYWFPGWLPWRTESRFPERVDDKPVNPLWACYGQGRLHHVDFLYFTLFFFYCKALKCCFKDDLWDTFHNITVLTFLNRLRLDHKNASLSSRSQPALFHVTLIRTAATDCHLHERAPVSRWEVACIWGKDSGTSEPVCLTDPKGAVNSEVLLLQLIIIVDTFALSFKMRIILCAEVYRCNLCEIKNQNLFFQISI